MRQALVLMGLCGVLSAQPAAILEPTLLSASQAIRVLELEGRTYHVQGIDTDGDRLWVTAVDRPTSRGFLYEYSLKDGQRLRSIELQDGDRYHPGGIAVDDTSIWIPIAEYRAQSTAIIQRRNKKTLELELQFPVPDHIGCVAVTPEFIIGGNWDSRDLYVWDHQGRLIRKMQSTTGNAYQDIKVAGDRLVGAGTLAGGQGAIDWMELSSAQLQRRILLGTTDHRAPLSREGMTVVNGQVWFLPEDEASRLFMIPLK